MSVLSFEMVKKYRKHWTNRPNHNTHQKQLNLCDTIIALKQENDKLKKALRKLMNQCRQTSNAIGKTGHRIFGSDDFMMVWEDIEELLKQAEGN